MTTEYKPAKPTKPDMKRWLADPVRYQNELADYAEFHFDPTTARVLEGPPLVALVEARNAREMAQAQLDAVQTQIDVAVAEARQAGASWNVIASVLGVSRQAARQRYARPTG